MEERQISKAVIKRLPRYYRYLGEILDSGMERISSGELSSRMKVTASQIRQDLNHFGGFGQQGYGYNVRFLHDEIGKILGLDQTHNIIVIGAGNLGSALSQYHGFRERGFEIKGIFDNDLNKVGLMLNGLPIYPINEMADYIEANGISIAIIAVPGDYAQDVADILVETPIKGILNFAPVVLTVPDEVEVRNVDLSVNLEVLSYNIENNLDTMPEEE